MLRTATCFQQDTRTRSTHSANWHPSEASAASKRLSTRGIVSFWMVPVRDRAMAATTLDQSLNSWLRMPILRGVGTRSTTLAGARSSKQQ